MSFASARRASHSKTSVRRVIAAATTPPGIPPLPPAPLLAPEPPPPFGAFAPSAAPPARSAVLGPPAPAKLARRCPTPPAARTPPCPALPLPPMRLQREGRSHSARRDRGRPTDQRPGRTSQPGTKPGLPCG